MNRDTELIDMDKVEEVAVREKPKMILAGFSAYSRSLEWKRFRDIADKVGAFLFADIAHIAGLIAGKQLENPCAVLRRRFDNDAQNASWTARRHDHVQGEIRRRDR